MTSPFSGLSAPMPAPRTFGFVCCVLADIVFLLDASTRWYVGLGFLHNAEWRRTAAVMVLVFVVLNALLMRFGVPGWLQGLAVFPLLVCAAVVTCAGSGLMDWRDVPVLSGILKQGWEDVLLSEGFRTPVSGALLHGLFGWFVRRQVRRPLWAWPEAAVALCGTGLFLLQRVAKAGIMSVYPDPRLIIVAGDRYAELPELPPERAALWLAVGTAAIVLLVAAAVLRIARLAWLYRVEKSKVRGFSLRPVAIDTGEAADGAEAPVFTLVPFRKPVRVLVRGDAQGEHVVARVRG